MSAEVDEAAGSAEPAEPAGSAEPGGAPATTEEHVADLVRLLDIEQLDTDLFRGSQPETTRRRMFGGQVAAQALMAAIRSVDEGMAVHSLHSYFLLPGDYTAPTIYDVERIRDGRSFATRRVAARQRGRVIYYQTVSFHVAEEGLEHQDAMPEVADPGSGIDMLALMTQGRGSDGAELGAIWGALEVRLLGTSRHGLEADPAHPSQARMWVRIGGELPEDPAIHQALFVFASDISLLGASLAAHRVRPTELQMASLDHSVWFHRPLRADQWWLYDQWSPSAQGGRGLSLGRVFRPDGVLAATVAQEGIIRPLREK